MENKEPMTQKNDEWSSTRLCPCGDNFSWSEFDSDLQKWTEKHKRHTNGKLLQEAGSDWSKVYSEKPDPTITDL